LAEKERTVLDERLRLTDVLKPPVRTKAIGAKRLKSVSQNEKHSMRLCVRELQSPRKVVPEQQYSDRDVSLRLPKLSIQMRVQQSHNKERSRIFLR
jgi:hypothetical protein